MILAMILYRVLEREIGQKSLKDDEVSDLGIKAMKVEFMVSYNLPVILHSSTTLSRSFPISS